jgi:hypothetical protein
VLEILAVLHGTIKYAVGIFKVVRAAGLKIHVFRDLALFLSVNGSSRLEGWFCLHI